MDSKNQIQKREIKFRVWTGQKMEYNIMAGFLGAFYVQGMDERDNASMSQFNTIYPDDTPVMQFTGLLDLNGKEIYEGDVLKDSRYTEKIKVIEWDNFLASYNTPLQNDCDQWYEVIGNIYENRELI